jgi:hypothetical protein
MFSQAFGLKKGSATSIKNTPDLKLNDKDILTPSPPRSPQLDKVATGIEPSSHPAVRAVENTLKVSNTQKRDKSGLLSACL